MDLEIYTYRIILKHYYLTNFERLTHPFCKISSDKDQNLYELLYIYIYHISYEMITRISNERYEKFLNTFFILLILYLRCFIFCS